MTPPEPATGIDWVNLILNPAIIALLVTIIIGAVYRLVDVKRPRLRIYTHLYWETRPHADDGQHKLTVVLANTGDGPAFNVVALPYGCGWQFNPHEGDWGEGKNGGVQDDTRRPVVKPGEAWNGFIFASPEERENAVLLITWEQRTAFRGVQPRAWAITLWDLPKPREWGEVLTDEQKSDPRAFNKWFKKASGESNLDILTPPRRGRGPYMKHR